MHPAYSVIFFTVASGAGYGLMCCISLSYLLGSNNPDWSNMRFASIVAFVLIVAGLLSSTFHLGHPERAWRAISQWRTSWLSREGLVAILSLLAITLFIFLQWTQPEKTTPQTLSATASLILSLVTVACTGMIYASLKPVPRWHHPLVTPLYLMFALGSGSMLFLFFRSITSELSIKTIIITIAVLLTAWLMKWLYWKNTDQQKPASSLESATGLGNLGKVSVLEQPHTSKNYVQKEMGFVVARKHAQKLRGIALLSGAVIPTIGLLILIVAPTTIQPLLTLIIVVFTLTGLLVERWLFFAEAEHVANLYYSG